MATFNIKSTIITNRDATPKVLTDPFVAAGDMKSAEGYVQSNGTNDDAGSIYRMFPVPSNARVDKMVLSNTALGSGCTLNVGVYWPTFIPSGAGLSQSSQSLVINATMFASALAASGANTATNILAQSGFNTIPKQEMPLWQALGLSEDPKIDLDVCVTLAGAVGGTQGYIGVKADYVF